MTDVSASLALTRRASRTRLRTPDDPTSEESARSRDTVAELPKIVGRNLRRLRVSRGHSLQRFARLSGVSRAMLSQIELGRSTPTIGVLWKVANALNVTFAALTSAGNVGGTTVLRHRRTKILSASEGQFLSRALSAMDGERRTEFYELRIAPDHEERAEPHAAGTIENLVVETGVLDIFDGNEWHRLEAHDAITFEAGLEHAYRNPGPNPAVAYLVMTYADAIG